MDYYFGIGPLKHTGDVHAAVAFVLHVSNVRSILVKRSSRDIRARIYRNTISSRSLARAQWSYTRARRWYTVMRDLGDTTS